MTTLVIGWSITEVIGLSIIGLFLLCYFLFWLIRAIKNFNYHVFHCKAWARVYTDAPQLLLDRKWGVEYKKHWWNKYKKYIDPERKYQHDYLMNEAQKVVDEIESGKIKI